MAQVTTGLRSLLSLPLFYKGLQSLLGAYRYRRIITREYLLNDSPASIIDIGCGPCDILEYIPPETQYIGVDSSRQYIESAVKRFDDRGTFMCLPVDAINTDNLPKVSCIIATGLLHHLDDEEVTGLCATAKSLLQDDGKFITVDPTFVAGQNFIAKTLISNDRGQNVRSPEAYRSLASEIFASVRADVRHDLLYVPYTHAILECRL